MEKLDYSAMTVNERLFAAGLLEQFDKAIRSNDSKKAITLLLQVDMSLTQSQGTVETILKNPKIYGY